MIIYVDVKDNKINITKEQFEDILRKKYNEGYDNGKNTRVVYRYSCPYNNIWCPYRTNYPNIMYTTDTITTTDKTISTNANTINANEYNSPRTVSIEYKTNKS